jgi:23S rRNA (cytidine1920-2'-O)/16S rRNA (cytidine1409-2'-O)-methyltransferase
VSGAPADKASRLVRADEALVLHDPPSRFVGRGGDKLDSALERFPVAVAGRRALDAGASTGGFTDCLLQRGAKAVVAVDVGRGQLHPLIRQDPRVTVMERTDVRSLSVRELGGSRFELVVADLSFISLQAVAPTLTELAAPDADIVVLIKPQFEAGRVEASRGKGVIRDPAVWRRVLREVCAAFAARDAAMMGVMVSPITGAQGNVEFLGHARVGGGGPPSEPDLDAVVAEAMGR